MAAKTYGALWGGAIGLSVIHCLLPAIILMVLAASVAMRYELRTGGRAALNQANVAKNAVKPVLARRVPVRVVAANQPRKII